MALRTIVVVGGGTAGWMAAAALANHFNPQDVTITLVESESIGTVGVGEATIPHIRYFNRRLGIDEREFVRATNATYKLGIELANWSRLPGSYVHPFGDFGEKYKGEEFYLAWLAFREINPGASFADFSVPVKAAFDSKFTYPKLTEASWQEYSYAFHLDATKYAHYLRAYAEKKGVNRIEGIIKNVELGQSGDIRQLLLNSGEIITGDLFIDCSGFRSLLLGQKLNVEFLDWSHWLLCDRAIALPTTSDRSYKPYTRAEAMSCGWRWQIPLINRTGNGLVYNSASMDDEAAYAYLKSRVLGDALAEPNFIRFKAGRRHVSWSRNCVGIGLSSGFLEPLESTSIYLIQLGIMKLLELYSPYGENIRSREEFNSVLALEYERVRDFVIAHYWAAQRDDSEFWQYCSSMGLPDSLQERLDLFRFAGQLYDYDVGLFKTPSWAAMLIGQSYFPKTLPARVMSIDSAELKRYMANLEGKIADFVKRMPSHADFLKDLGLDSQVPPSGMNFYGVFA